MSRESFDGLDARLLKVGGASILERGSLKLGVGYGNGRAWKSSSQRILGSEDFLREGRGLKRFDNDLMLFPTITI